MNRLSADEIEATGESDQVDAVRRWRHEQLIRLGFDDSQATLLAFCSHVDLGQVRDLTSRGCDRTTLIRIVI